MFFAIINKNLSHAKNSIISSSFFYDHILFLIFIPCTAPIPHFLGIKFFLVILLYLALCFICFFYFNFFFQVFLLTSSSCINFLSYFQSLVLPFFVCSKRYFNPLIFFFFHSKTYVFLLFCFYEKKVLFHHQHPDTATTQNILKVYSIRISFKTKNCIYICLVVSFLLWILTIWFCIVYDTIINPTQEKAQQNGKE